MRAALLAVALAACSYETSGPSGERPSAAEEALRAEGLTDIAFTGPAVLVCSGDDSVLTSKTFTALNREGVRVEGAVCCGLIFKSCTVRW